ncbi:DoxX family protein [Actinophytocola sp. NPDC049390]|uniref:DoxX family protein n=1 Tax=Actinophytocola sp. NPDC049390 TaxID=3363894 RepID=UPI003790B140
MAIRSRMPRITRPPSPRIRQTRSYRERLAPMMGWVDTIPMPVVRGIGTVEVLGLVLPPLTGIAPVLAVVAAIGFAVLQVLATGLHLSRKEVKETGLNVPMIALAVVAAWLATVW